MITLVIDFTEMDDLLAQEPADTQQCTVAILDKSGGLVAYYSSAAWNAECGDWIDISGWVGGASTPRDLAEARSFAFFWKPAHQPCDRP